MNTGMDPEVKRYFKKIINTFSISFLWLLSVTTLGFYFSGAIIGNSLRWFNIVFYLFFLLSFSALLRYYFKAWKDLK